MGYHHEFQLSCVLCSGYKSSLSLFFIFYLLYPCRFWKQSAACKMKFQIWTQKSNLFHPGKYSRRGTFPPPNNSPYRIFWRIRIFNWLLLAMSVSPDQVTRALGLIYFENVFGIRKRVMQFPRCREAHRFARPEFGGFPASPCLELPHTPCIYIYRYIL